MTSTSPGTLTFRPFVGGADVEGVGWVHAVSADLYLDDPFAAFRLKYRLDRGDQDARGQPGVLSRCGLSDLDMGAAALRAAAEAAPRWAMRPWAERRQVGSLFRERLLAGQEHLTGLMVAEGTPRSVARWQISGMLACVSDESLKFYDECMLREFQHEGRRLLVRRQPDGVVCVNPSRNGPAAGALLGALALLAGNTIVVRAPRDVPTSVHYALRELVAPALDRLDAPPGTLNILCGAPGPLLDQWLASPLVDDILYVGNSRRGLAFERDCVAAGKKPVLELSGNDGVIVWRDADLPAAARAVAESFHASGQICMVPNYVVAHPEVAGELADRVCALAKAMRPGHPGDPDVRLAALRSTGEFFSCLDDVLARGARVLCGGGQLDVRGEPSGHGLFVEPTVVRVDGLEHARDFAAVREETFFPLLPIVVPDAGETGPALLDRVIDFVNGNEYGLRNSLWATDPDVIARVTTRVTNGGLLTVNASHSGFVPCLPTHGGTGMTGGVFGEANYPVLRTSHLQGVCIA